MIAAIDFGASSTKVAVAQTGANEPRMIEFGADLEFPTAIYFDRDGNILVGDDAVNMAGQDEGRFAPSLKQQINSGLSADPRAHRVFVAHPVTLVTAVSRVLAYAFDEACANAVGDMDMVILTHPVAWGERELVLLVSAARAAGITCPIRLLPEPLAVAGLRLLRPETPGQVAVFDLGASTFDAAILGRGTRDLLEPQYVGQRLYGGDNVDDALRQLILDFMDDPAREDFKAAYESRRFDVDKAVRAAKIRLSERERMRFLFGERAKGVDLTRENLEAKVDRELKRCAATLGVGLSELPELAEQRLAALILSGGASRMPLVGQRADDLARKHGLAKASRVPEGISPGHVVALGAVDAALSGAYGPVTEAAARTSISWDSRRVTRGATWSEADSDRTAWLAAFAQYPVGALRRRIIFVNAAGEPVASAAEGGLIAVWRGWDVRDLRGLSTDLVLSPVWSRYQTVHGVPALQPARENECRLLDPVRPGHAVVARCQGEDPQCGWLDGHPVALLHRTSWSALVEIGNSYNNHHRRYPVPSRPSDSERSPFRTLW